MVIHTNLAAASGVPAPKSNDRPNSKSKTVSSPGNPAGQTGAVTFDFRLERTLPSSDSDIEDGNQARRGVQLIRASILAQPSIGMLAQANLSPETVLNLLQE